MKSSESFRLLHTLRGIMMALEKLVEVQAHVPEPERGRLEQFVLGCRAMVAELDGLPVPLRSTKTFAAAGEVLATAAKTNSDIRTPYDRVGVAASALASELAELVADSEERLARLKTELAATTTPDEKSMKRLSRYHSMLTRAMSEELDLIAKMRAIGSKKKRSSFGAGDSASRRLLRVVR